ncbi:MAG: hypothetical protein L0Y73_01805 [Candidatus Aminicenantes bacterium]|nr:hypothetical protein [Candidatus Aminicenantes bacterium]
MPLQQMKAFSPRQVQFKIARSANEPELEKAAEEFIEEHGGQSLGDIDTPSFIRKVSNISLMPPPELLQRKTLLVPDKKILELIAVLRGYDRCPAGT